MVALECSEVDVEGTEAASEVDVAWTGVDLVVVEDVEAQVDQEVLVVLEAPLDHF